MRIALERARRVQGQDDGPWSVGVRDARGSLLAQGLLESYAQVRAFAAAMGELGYEHCLRGSREDSGCCDFTFRQREAAASPRALLAA
jgi:hypothetical protein